MRASKQINLGLKYLILRAVYYTLQRAAVNKQMYYTQREYSILNILYTCVIYTYTFALLSSARTKKNIYINI